MIRLSLHQTTSASAWWLKANGGCHRVLSTVANTHTRCNDWLALFGCYSTLVQLDNWRLVPLELVCLDSAHVRRLWLWWSQWWVWWLIELVGHYLAHGCISSTVSFKNFQILIRRHGIVFFGVEWPGGSHPLDLVTGQVFLCVRLWLQLCLNVGFSWVWGLWYRLFVLVCRITPSWIYEREFGSRLVCLTVLRWPKSCSWHNSGVCIILVIKWRVIERPTTLRPPWHRLDLLLLHHLPLAYYLGAWRGINLLRTWTFGYRVSRLLLEIEARFLLLTILDKIIVITLSLINIIDLCDIVRRLLLWKETTRPRPELFLWCALAGLDLRWLSCRGE